VLFTLSYGFVFVGGALGVQSLAMVGVIFFTPASIAAIPAFLLASLGISWAATGYILPIPTVAGMVLSVAFWAAVAELLAFLYRHRHHRLLRGLMILVAVGVALFFFRGVIATAVAPYVPEACRYSGAMKDRCFTRAAHERNDASYCHRGDWAYWDEGYLPCLEPFLTAQTPVEFCDAIQKPKTGVFNACLERLAELHRDPSICMYRTVDREQCAERVSQSISPVTPSPLPIVPPADGGQDTACTADAMQCPDGTWVGRTPPRCEFVCP